MRQDVRLFGLAVLAIVCGTALMLLVSPAPVNDFVEYWAAGRLNLSGENPYDPVLMMELQRSVGFAGEKALMMLNPPPVLTLVMPFGALPYRPAVLLWFVLHTVLLLWSCTLLWDLAGGPGRLRWIAYLCGLIFVPTLFALFAGQISILLLLGLVLFLQFLRAGRRVASGAAATLLLVKPHVVYLVGVALVAWCLRSRDRRVLLGMALGGIGFLVPLAFNPSVYAQYLELSRVESLDHFSTSTLGTLLRVATGHRSRFGFQFVPMVLGLSYLAIRLRKNRLAKWDWDREMPLLVVMSVTTAAYGWVFDQVVLLVAAIPMFVAAIRAGGARLFAMVGFWTIVGGVAFVQAFRGVNSLWYYWIPFAFLVALIGLGLGPGKAKRPAGLG